MDIVIGGNSGVTINWVPCDPLGNCSFQFYCGCYNACGCNNWCACLEVFCECYGAGSILTTK